MGHTPVNPAGGTTIIGYDPAGNPIYAPGGSGAPLGNPDPVSTRPTRGAGGYPGALGKGARQRNQNQRPPATTNEIAEGPVAAIAADGGIALPFGKFRMEGTFLYQQAGNVTDANFAIGWCAGPIASIDRVFLNDFDYSGITGVSYTHYLGYYTNAQGQTIDSWLNSLGYAHRFPGIAWTRVYAVGQASYNPQWRLLFADNALTKASVEGTGLVLYDPRKDSTNGGTGSHRTNNIATWEASSNPALAVRWLLANDVHGFGATDAQIDDASFIAAADYCDATVNSKPRWSVNGVINGGGGEAVLQQLLAACDAELFQEKGRYKIRCHQTQSSVVLALDTATNCREVEYVPRASRDVPTRVTVKFQNRAKNWTEDTARADHPLLATGGVELRETVLDLGTIKDEEQAHRIATRYLNRQLMNLKVGLVASFSGIKLTRDALFTLTTSDGPAAQAFTVYDYERMPTGEYKISGLQYADSLCDENTITVDTPPSTSFIQGSQTLDDVAFAVTAASPVSIYWAPPRYMGVAGTAALIPNGMFVWKGYAIADFGANGAKCGKLVTTIRYDSSSFPYPPLAVAWSDDASNWTNVTTSQVGKNDAATWSGMLTKPYVCEWATPAAAHRYWRYTFSNSDVNSTGMTGTSSFLPVLGEVDFNVAAYEVYDGGTFANVNYAQNANVPLWKVIPADSIPTSTTPLDLTETIRAWTTETPAHMISTIRVVPVHRNGTKGAGAQGGYFRIVDAVGKSAIALGPTALTNQPVQGGSTNIDGTQRAAVTTSSDYAEWETGSTTTASASGKARVRCDGSKILASVNTDAYSKVIRAVDVIAPRYGEMYISGNSTSQTLTTQNTWYKWTTGWIAGEPASRFNYTQANGELTAYDPGVYFVQANLDYSGLTAGRHVEWAIFVNGSIVADHHVSAKAASGNPDMQTIVGGLMSLSANDVLDVRVRCVDRGNEVITVERANFTAFSLGSLVS